MSDIEFDEDGCPKIWSACGLYVQLALDAHQRRALCEALNAMFAATFSIPHPRTLTDLIRYVGVLEHPRLDARCARLIRSLARVYNLLPGDS